jgi:hypothetical protein
MSLPSDKTPPPSGRQTPVLPSAIRRFKSEWGPNAISLEEVVGRRVIIEQQPTTQIRRILIPKEECERVSHVISELHFMTKRLFLLYGTLPCDYVVRVHAVSLHAQSFSNSEYKLNELHRKSSDDLAQVLGLRLVGVIVVNEMKSPPIDPETLLYLGRLAPQIGPHFTVVCGLPHDGACNFEAFQLSSQFIDEMKNDLFVGPSGDSALAMKNPVLLYTKLSDIVDVNYFLVNVAIETRVSWFPRVRFPFQAFYPTVSDFAEAMKADFDVPDFVRLLDWSLLLFLEQWFTPGNEIPMIARTCVAKRALPIGITSRIEEILESARILRS